MVPLSASATSFSPTLKLIALVMYLPEELSFYIFQFRLTLIRLVLFFLTPVLLVHLGQLLASRKRHLVFSDILIVLTGVWMIVSPAIVVDLGYSLNHSAAGAAEFCGSYLAGRILLSERGQTLSFVNFLCHVIVIIALFGVLDVLTSRPIIHEFLGQLTGYTNINTGTSNVGGGLRMGFFRATGPIGHPILYGIVCAIGLLLAVASPIRAKGLTIAACGLGVLLSLSSAPIEGAILGLGLLTYNRLLARFRSRWSILIGIGALGIGVSFALSTSPLAFVLGHINLDPTSYWVRLYQWQTVGTIVLNSPWVGIGFNLVDVARKMPVFIFASVDSLWLWLAMVYGFPGAILVGLSMVSAACYPVSGRDINLTIEESKLATTLSVIIAMIVLLGFTVDFWEESWMLAGLLVGVRAHLADLGSQRSSTPTNTDPDGARQRSSHRSLGGKRGPDESFLARPPLASVALATRRGNAMNASWAVQFARG
jgi:hypothetical protein